MYNNFEHFIEKNLYYNTEGIIAYLLMEGGGPINIGDVENLYNYHAEEIAMLKNNILEMEEQMANPICSDSEFDKCLSEINDTWNQINELEKEDGQIKEIGCWYSCSFLMGEILYAIGEPVVAYGNVAYWGKVDDESVMHTDTIFKLKDYLYKNGYIQNYD